MFIQILILLTVQVHNIDFIICIIYKLCLLVADDALFYLKKHNLNCRVWCLTFWVWFCSGLLFSLWEKGWSRTRSMQEDWWQEMAVCQRCVPRLKVLWAPHAPQPFKKARGIKNHDTVFLHCDITYCHWKQRWDWEIP